LPYLEVKAAATHAPIHVKHENFVVPNMKYDILAIPKSRLDCKRIESADHFYGSLFISVGLL